MGNGPLRVLVCGGRNFNNAMLLGSWLGGLHKQRGIACLIDGGARGADHMAHEFAKWAGIPTEQYPAEWGRYGRSAGPGRNQRMLDQSKPDLVVAFAGGPGTADMIRRAAAAGIPILDTSSPESVAKYRLALMAEQSATDA